MKLTPQQALEEARKRYTEGTVLITTFFKDEITIKDSNAIRLTNGVNFYICTYNGSILYESETNTWAEIISTPKSLEDRLVDGFGFVKRTFPHGEFTTNRYEKDGLSIDFDYENGKVCSVDIQIEKVSFAKPNNLESFVKYYLELGNH